MESNMLNFSSNHRGGGGCKNLVKTRLSWGGE